MADRPSSGATNWGTTLNAHIAVGHDNDGTHKKSQVLTDMGWSPTSYAGEESITLPNGLILKQGIESVAANTTDEVTYAVAFPTAFVNSWCSFNAKAVALVDAANCQEKSGSSTSILEVTNGHTSTQNISWYAIGY